MKVNYNRVQHGGPICPAAEMIGPRQFGNQRGWPRDPPEASDNLKDAYNNLMRNHQLHESCELPEITKRRLFAFLDASTARSERQLKEQS